jgi:uncharacterized protein
MQAMPARRTQPAAGAMRRPCATARPPWRQPLLLWLWCCALGWATLLPGALWAQTTPLQPIPALTARVLDHTATLSATQRQALEDKLAAFERERGSQVVVLLIATTAPEDIFSYTQRVAEAWKVGRADVGDGVLLVVAKDDRRLRIATMRAVEGAIPDLAARRIIDEAITPHFRQGDYAAGLNAGVEQILALLRGENLPLPAPDGQRASGGTSAPDDWVLLAFLALFVNLVLRQRVGRWGPWLATPVVSVLGWQFTESVWRTLLTAVITLGLGLLLARLKAQRSGTRRRRGGGRDDWPGGGWGGGGGSGGGSGGGFSSGGGGRSSGGGASGGW